MVFQVGFWLTFEVLPVLASDEPATRLSHPGGEFPLRNPIDRRSRLHRARLIEQRRRLC
jgi:hypothetical protein